MIEIFTRYEWLGLQTLIKYALMYQFFKESIYELKLSIIFSKELWNDNVMTHNTRAVKTTELNKKSCQFLQNCMFVFFFIRQI